MNREGGRGKWFVFGVGLLVHGVAILRAERITIATYNVENYLATNRMVEGEYRLSYPKPEEEKTALRSVIRALNADVIVFQEMGTLGYLKELQRDLKKEGCEYPFGELLEAGDTERHLAVLSRRALTKIRRHTEMSFEYFGTAQTVKRGMLELHFPAGKSEITLFALHLKSRFTDRPDDPNSELRRSGEAKAVRDRVLEVVGDPVAARFLILGDFNDVPRSRPLQAIAKKRKTTIADLLVAKDSRGESWTHCYQKEDSYSRVDYILVSPGLRNTVIDGHARILDTPETLVASDHRPVVVVVEVN